MKLRLAFYLLATGFGVGMVARANGVPFEVYVFISAVMVWDIVIQVMIQVFRDAYEYDKARGRWWTKRN